jgi:hypothetical protein
MVFGTILTVRSTNSLTSKTVFSVEQDSRIKVFILRYVIFPIQVLAKSCKPVPVMLFGAIMGKVWM